MYQKIVTLLTKKNLTIAFMESCTGGYLASEITSIPGASEVLKFSAITYSNEYKIKMGVSSKIIEQYSVYSKETAIEMSKKISQFANSDIGVGVTGKFGQKDPYNLSGDDSIVFISIYVASFNQCYCFSISVDTEDRIANKKKVAKVVGEKILEILS